MEKLPAATGWQWIKQGFSLFRKQPAELSTLFLSYMFLMMVITIIPLLGQVLPLILIPVFSMAFMQACVQVEKGQRVYPNLLLTGFRSPAFRTLVMLGLLYVLAATLAIGASALIDGGLFWDVMVGSARVEATTVQDSHITLAMLTAGVLYLPAAMAFWFAAPLIAWQGMGLGKALFYSFYAVRRAGRAFAVYGLGWALVGVIFPLLLSTLMGQLTGSPVLMMMVLLPLSIVLTVVMYCSFYPTYTALFGKPPQ
nr:BPSS1780 family membrane protein [uncultured Noviherbaspirillum sp.]